MKIRIMKGDYVQPYWVTFEASNGETIAHTENYARKADAVNAANIIKRDAGAATIVDNT